MNTIKNNADRKIKNIRKGISKDRVDINAVVEKGYRTPEINIERYEWKENK